MKKLFKLFVVALLLTGCSSSPSEPEKTMICRLEKDGATYEDRIIYQGDTVNSILYTTIYDFQDETLTPLYEEYKNEQIKLYSEHDSYIHYELTIDGTVATETTGLDYLTADFAKLGELGFVAEVDGEFPDYIDFELTLSNLKNEGFICSSEE